MSKNHKIVLNSCGKHNISLFLPAVFLTVLSIQAAPPPEKNSQSEELGFIPLEAIVKLKAGAEPRLYGLPRYQLRPLGNRVYLAFSTTEPVTDDPIEATNELIEHIASLANVEYAHLNTTFKLAFTPSDPLYGEQWNFPAANIEPAWNYTTGDPSIRIAILDTGRTAHPDVQWHPTLEHPAGQADDVGWWTPSGWAYWRHGTHVASIAGALTNNGIGTAGVCPGCSLVPVKIFGTSSQDALVEAIEWVMNSASEEIHILNMSFEDELNRPCTHGALTTLRTRIEEAVASGIHIVAAAGNSSSTAIPAPASCPDVISVAATDQNGQLAPYSNYGEVVLAAPGGGGINNSVYGASIGCPPDPDSGFNPFYHGVPAAWTTSPNSNPSDAHCYRYLSGTSMAAPHVSGTIGLILSLHASMNPSPAKVREALQASASPVPGCGSDCGAGLLNVEAAVDKILDWCPIDAIFCDGFNSIEEPEYIDAF